MSLQMSQNKFINTLNKIHTSKYSSVTEEERKLYERFEESFHVADNCASTMEAQYKYGSLLWDPK